jgi:hypothetical protein
MGFAHIGVRIHLFIHSFNQITPAMPFMLNQNVIVALSLGAVAYTKRTISNKTG